MKKLCIALAAAVSLSACAPTTPLNFSVQNVEASQHKINAELKAITVTIANPDEKEGDLPSGIEMVTPMWKESLEDALDRMAIFRDGSARKVSLSVKILAVDIPSAGFSFTTTAVAQYALIDRNTGATLYSETIKATGVAPADFNSGGERARLSVNKAIQNNIAKFLASLKKVKSIK